MTTAVALDEKTFAPLTLADRCDHCGKTAAAVGRAVKGDLELMFCGHHLDKFSKALDEQGFFVIDSREGDTTVTTSGDDAF